MKKKKSHWITENKMSTVADIKLQNRLKCPISMASFIDAIDHRGAGIVFYESTVITWSCKPR